MRDLQIDEAFLNVISLLSPLYHRVHITGGEPFLYPHLDELINRLTKNRFQVALTTNGFFPLQENLSAIQKLDYMNISFHSLRTEYLSNLIGNSKDPGYVLSVIMENMKKLSGILPVRINTVVSHPDTNQGIEEVLKFAGMLGFELKLVPEWKVRHEAMRQISRLLEENDFRLFEKIYLLPGSNVRERYKNPAGQIVEVKNIILYQPDFLCKSCHQRTNCQEGFSFLRVGGSPLYLQPCIFGKKYGIQDFEKKILPDIQAMFREVYEK